MARKDLNGAMRASKLFSGMSEAEMNALVVAGDAVITELGTGDELTRAGERLEGIYLVLNGVAEVFKPSGAGHVLISRLERGAVVGAVSVFGDDKTAATTVAAKTPLTVLHISEDAFRDLLTRNPQMLNTFLRYLTGRVRFLVQKLEVLGADSASDKLYTHIVNNAIGNTYKIDSSVTALADALGMGRVSLYRAIDDLTERGIIRREGKSITLLGDGINNDTLL